MKEVPGDFDGPSGDLDDQDEEDLSIFKDQERFENKILLQWGGHNETEGQFT